MLWALVLGVLGRASRWLPLINTLVVSAHFTQEETEAHWGWASSPRAPTCVWFGWAPKFVLLLGIALCSCFILRWAQESWIWRLIQLVRSNLVYCILSLSASWATWCKWGTIEMCLHWGLLSQPLTKNEFTMCVYIPSRGLHFPLQGLLYKC